MAYDVAVVGGGPAGASAALFVAKAGKKTLLIDADKGMTRRAMVYNFYGVPEIRGPDLMDTGHRQAAHFGAELIKAAVTDVERTEDGFRLVTEQGDFHARYVILATGATADLAAKIGLESRPATEPRIKTVLVVDPAGRTNVPGIWAAGTVAGVERGTRSGIDDPGAFDARHAGEGDAFGEPQAQVKLGAVQSEGLDADADPSRIRLRHGQVAQVQRLGRARRVELDGLHRFQFVHGSRLAYPRKV